VAAGGAKIEPTFVKRVLKAAQIVLSDKAPKLECPIRNLTQAAARLQLSITYSLPVNFEVYRPRRLLVDLANGQKNRNYICIE
jgi:hypothetical protein